MDSVAQNIRYKMHMLFESQNIEKKLQYARIFGDDNHFKRAFFEMDDLYLVKNEVETLTMQVMGIDRRVF